MAWQRYTDPVALERMERGDCPECGKPPQDHGGLGGNGCSLTDNGVANRIAGYRADKADGDLPLLEPKDVRFDIFSNSSGCTVSATHIPTGTRTSSHTGSSQVTCCENAGLELRRLVKDRLQPPRDRYFLKADHEDQWKEVTREQFISAESAAGFHSKFGPGTVATGGFGGHGMSGRVVVARSQSARDYYARNEPEFYAQFLAPQAQRDDTDLIQGYLDRGEPIPTGVYTIRRAVTSPPPGKVTLQLDRAALKKLRDMWEGAENFGILDATVVIRDLFGGQDGTLSVINDAIGFSGRV